MSSEPLLEKIDCTRFFVPDLQTGLDFYCNRLGHTLVWRTEVVAGLRMPGTDAEIVIQTRDPGMDIDFKVASVAEAVTRFEAAGGKVVVAPFDIQIGRAAVVEDPWGNRMVLLDTSKGLLVTDAAGHVVGVAQPMSGLQLLPAGARLENTALVVIDVINSCALEQYEDPARGIYFNKVRQMVPLLSDFMSAFKRLGGKVILLTTVPWQEPYLPDNINELYRDNPAVRYWSADTGGHAEQFYAIPTEGAAVFTKATYDAFSCQDFTDALEKAGIRYVIITGVFGDGCVNATINGGFSRGYHFIIARDLIETADDPNRQIIQQHLKAELWPTMYGMVIGSAEILSHFSSGR